MPWKLIFFIICIVLVTIFVGFNLENRCDVSFVFFKLEQVPIFLSLTVAFVLGVVSALPFAFIKKKQKKQTPEKQKIDTYKEKITEKNKKTSLVQPKEPLSSKEQSSKPEEPKV